MRRETGTVVCLKVDRGFGLLRMADRREVFFHATDCGLPFDDSLMERCVTFAITETEKGQRATDVQPI